MCPVQYVHLVQRVCLFTLVISLLPNRQRQCPSEPQWNMVQPYLSSRPASLTKLYSPTHYFDPSLLALYGGSACLVQLSRTLRNKYYCRGRGHIRYATSSKHGCLNGLDLFSMPRWPCSEIRRSHNASSEVAESSSLKYRRG